MKGESFSSRNDVLSSQRKPLSNSLVKTYSNRPNSALRSKYENHTNHSSLSPARNEYKSAKRLSPTRYPTTTSSTRTLDQRLNNLRRKNEENSSTNLSKSTTWDKQLHTEESNNGKGYSTLNLKGYSVAQNGVTTLLHKSSIMTSPYSSKSPLYNSVSSLSNRSLSPTRKLTSQNKERNTKGQDLNLSLTTLSSLKDETKKGLNSYTPTKYAKALQQNAEGYLPQFEPTKCSIKHNGVIKAYAVNTHQGIVRNYNEDRVSIILNIMKPPHVTANQEWPLCSFFGVYDGHGGTNCADFLRDNLHQYVIQDKHFPKNPIEALKKGFEQAERAFREIAQQSKIEIDRSGSCAIVALVVGKIFIFPHIKKFRGYVLYR